MAVYKDGEVYGITRPADYNTRCAALVRRGGEYRSCGARPTWVRSAYFVCSSHARATMMVVPHARKEEP